MKREDWRLLKKLPLTAKAQLDLCLLPLIVQPPNDAKIEDLYHRSLQDTLFEPLEKIQDYLLNTIGATFLVLQHYTDGDLNAEAYFKVTLGKGLIKIDVISMVAGRDLPFTALYFADGRATADSDVIAKDKLEEYASALTLHISYLIKFLSRAFESGLHPVRAKGVTAKIGQKGHRPRMQNDKKRWSRGDLTKIVFLDNLPIPSSKSDKHHGGTHASPVFHRRRGHYRIMRHEKYKNHPDYLKERWYAPTWVGDRSVVSGGITYTVLTS